MTRMTAANHAIVTAGEMQIIESRLFDAGMPIAALMEKVGLLLTQKIFAQYPLAKYPRISVLVGPGHNGGDAWVVARELWHQGYEVKVLQPLEKAKSLTQSHGAYGRSIGISVVTSTDEWLDADLIIDGLFGFGLTRKIQGILAQVIEQINLSAIPVVSIDIPSGLHTDTGQILGTAIAASHTFCLGLWKRAFFQEQALNSIGRAELLPFGIPIADQSAVLGDSPQLQTSSPEALKQFLPFNRPVAVHKYQMGAALLIAGSAQYPGAAVISAKAARASGVGMLYVAVPQSLTSILVSAVPDAVIVSCPENEQGAIASLPETFDLNRIDAIAIGPGLSLKAKSVVQKMLSQQIPLILDADALNLLAQLEPLETLSRRTADTILTPHWGEYKRLFEPWFSEDAIATGDRLNLFDKLKEQIPATVALKGAKTLISAPGREISVNAESTSALARGGSGDVLTGLLLGLLAQNVQGDSTNVTAAAVWWHAQSALMAEQNVTAAGVSPTVLIDHLIPFLVNYGEKKE